MCEILLERSLFLWLLGVGAYPYILSLGQWVTVCGIALWRGGRETKAREKTYQTKVNILSAAFPFTYVCSDVDPFCLGA
jgi:hypothetical protein